MSLRDSVSIPPGFLSYRPVMGPCSVLQSYSPNAYTKICNYPVSCLSCSNYKDAKQPTDIF